MTGILKVDQIQNIEDASSVKVNRTTSDGTVLDIQKDGTSAGTLKTVSGVTLALDGSGSFVGFQLGGTGIVPRQNGTLSTSVDLGTSSYPFDNVYVGSNIYLGGTGSANALDDYEEGTWTPDFGNISAPTYTSRSGRYTKIGRIVYCTGEVVVSSLNNGDASGYAIIGLPFTGNFDEEVVNFTLGRFINLLGTTANQQTVHNIRFTGSSVMLLKSSDDNVPYNSGASSGTLQFSFTYTTD